MGSCRNEQQVIIARIKMGGHRNPHPDEGGHQGHRKWSRLAAPNTHGQRTRTTRVIKPAESSDVREWQMKRDLRLGLLEPGATSKRV